jgi:hypothetical protein
MRQFGSPVYEVPDAISADKLGNVYITGQTRGSLGGPYNGGPNDAFLAKFDAAGNLHWTKQLGTSANDLGIGVSADGMGNVYVAGRTEGSLGGTNAGGTDAFVAKYDAGGDVQWTMQLGTSEYDSGESVAVDSLDNVYIGGNTLSSLGGPNAGYHDAFVAKFNAAGARQWIRQLGSADVESPASVAVDILRNVYISGSTNGSLGGPNAGGTDAYIAKYDTTGNLQWARQLGTSAGEGATISVGGVESIYIAGGTEGSLGGPAAGAGDAYVAKYDMEGNFLWARQLGTSTNDGSRTVSGDGLGNVYISGLTSGNLGGPSAGLTDVYLAKYRDGPPGDYDNSGTVDAADYAVWRNTSGEAGASLAADGNGDGVVNQADYDVWRAHFGQTMSALSSTGNANAPVPEPGAHLLILFAMGMAAFVRRHGGFSRAKCYLGCDRKS